MELEKDREVSFFFDVWFSEGFVLASDVRLMVNDEPEHAHKIAEGARGSTVNCAIAVCGAYPGACLNFFTEASSRKDTLRDVAHYFASRWVEKYAGRDDYSAVHLVGYEKMIASGVAVPQMWFWCNWDGKEYLSREVLLQQLNTFAEPMPHNNHIPRKIKELTGEFPEPTFEDEYSLVATFLKHQPYFTWNGELGFWQSAADAVGGAVNLLRDRKTRWTLQEVSDITGICLKFLINLGNLLPDSTVGFSPQGEFDLLWVTPQDTKWIRRASLDDW